MLRRDVAHYKENDTLSTTLNTTALSDALNHPVPLAVGGL